jgi:pilus assembly protein CpaB
MNAKTWAPLAIAIVLGALAAKVGRDVMVRRAAAGQSLAQPMASAHVVVARENLAAGTALRAEDLATASIAQDSLAPGSFTDAQRLVSRVVTLPVLKGQPILENMLAPESTSRGLTAIVPDGWRAITLEINDVSGVAGLLVPGCRVDVVTTLGGGGEGGQSIARTVARNLQVLAVGRRLDSGAKDESPDAAPPARTVTLLVTPHDAELIDLAGHNGAPRLVLRGSRDSRGDLPSEPQGVTLAELRGGRSGEPSSGWLKGMVGGWLDPFYKAFAQQGPSRPIDGRQFRQVTVIRSGKEESVQVETGQPPKRIGVDLANTDSTEAIKTPGGGN